MLEWLGLGGRAYKSRLYFHLESGLWILEDNSEIPIEIISDEQAAYWLANEVK